MHECSISVAAQRSPRSSSPREYDLRVVAADLWIEPSDNWTRIKEAGCTDSVIPIRAEAHDLKFAMGYFDAIISVDAYHYFGTDERYLAYAAQFLRPGGHLGIVVPALVAELTDDEVPEHLQPYWVPDFWTFHSARWWRQLWSRSGEVDVDVADVLEDGWQDWALWNEMCVKVSKNEFVIENADREAQMIRLDAGRNLGFARPVSRDRAGVLLVAGRFPWSGRWQLPAGHKGAGITRH
jgi:SAM-dependent methyltransferase